MGNLNGGDLPRPSSELIKMTRQQADAFEEAKSIAMAHGQSFLIVDANETTGVITLSAVNPGNLSSGTTLTPTEAEEYFGDATASADEAPEQAATEEGMQVEGDVGQTDPQDDPQTSEAGEVAVGVSVPDADGSEDVGVPRDEGVEVEASLTSNSSEAMDVPAEAVVNEAEGESNAS